MRPLSVQYESASHRARGSATRTKSVIAAAPDEFLKSALAATATADHRALWTASRKSPGIKFVNDVAATSPGAYDLRNTSVVTKNRTVDPNVKSHTPKNFPSTRERSLTGDARSISSLPVLRSSLQTSMPKSAAKAGRTGDTEIVHRDASDENPPSPASRLKAKRAAAPARKSEIDNAATNVFATMPMVRLKVTRIGLIGQPPSMRIRRGLRFGRDQGPRYQSRMRSGLWTAQETS